MKYTYKYVDILYFKNPSNGYIAQVPKIAFLWVLLFGSFYFLVRGIWLHAIISLILAIVTGGLSWLIYPFHARDILEIHYLEKGWIRVHRLDDGISTYQL